MTTGERCELIVGHSGSIPRQFPMHPRAMCADTGTLTV
jgi:hypothetical protein